MPAPTVWLSTLGCAKNQVDSEKIIAMLSEAGYGWADAPEDADVVMVNTCAFIEEARAESVEAILEMEDRKRPEARSVVIGCMAQRFGSEVEAALPEVDAVLGIDRYGELVGVIDGLTGWEPSRSAAASGNGHPPRYRPSCLRPALCLPEGRRGLRQALHLLRNPLDPGQATLSAPGRDSGGARVADGRRCE